MNDKSVMKKMNIVDLVPSVGCVAVILYMFYILLSNLVIAMIPNGSWSDGTKSLGTLFVIVFFYCMTQYGIPEGIKKHEDIIYGFLFAMALVNSNFATVFLTFAFICYGMKKAAPSRCLSVFLALSLVLEGLQIFLIYNGLGGNMINEILVRSSWFVIWIMAGLFFAIKKPKFFSSEKKEGTGKCFLILAWLFLAAFVLCFLCGMIHRFVYTIPHLGKYLEFPYSGHGIPEIFSAFGRGYKIISLLLIVFLLGLQVLCFFSGKKKQDKMGLLFILMTGYGIFFASWAVLLIALAGSGIYFVSLHWKKQINMIAVRHMDHIALILLGVVFLIISFVITSGVNWGMNKKHTKIELNVEQLKDCEGALVGYDVLPDGCLRSNRIDPWIVLYYGQFGLFDVQNVNVKIKYCKRDYMYIFGIGQYNYDFKSIKNGDNYMDITFLTPDDMGIRFDLTEAYDSYILLDKIVFNDYSYIGTNLSKELRLIAYLLWMFTFVRILFSGLSGETKQDETKQNV